jgi:hypothetical protein
VIPSYPIARVIHLVRAALAGFARPPANERATASDGPAMVVKEATMAGSEQTPALWYPGAVKHDPPLAPLPTKGRYERGFPRGAVVHYTAGAYGLSELALARQLGYTYFLVDEHGGVHQLFPLDRWGSHAGESSWPGLDGKVSRHLVGIEVDCAGLVTPDGKGNFRSWWGALVAGSDTRIVHNKTAADDNRTAGAYHRFTDAQEDALVDLLVWMKTQAPEVFDLDLVLGHDEVSPGRKQDPGGSLSMPMPAFRAYVKARYRAAVAAGVRSA